MEGETNEQNMETTSKEKLHSMEREDYQKMVIEA
jgi:hypothetical protein